MTQSPLTRAQSIRRAIRLNAGRYVIAIVLVAIAIALRAALDSYLGDQGVTVFLAAVITAAWLGGVGPALLALVSLHLMHGYWFFKPSPLLEPTMESIVTTLAYYCVGIVVGLLSQLQTSAKQRAREQQVQAISQREHLRTTLACMADAVLVTDIHGRITLINPAAESMSGWGMAEGRGRLWSEILVMRRDDGTEAVENPIARVLGDDRVVHETAPLVLQSRTGRVIPVSYSAARVQDPDGQIEGAVLIFRDESERRRTELALRNADRRKDDFLATLAHELRNPLAPISMGVELIEMSADDREAVLEICGMMQRQTKHMVRLIDDLLDVSRITCGKLELRKTQVDLRDVVRDAVEAVRPLIDDSQHHLVVRFPDKRFAVFADANRLTQVLTNLLSNAAKYTPPNGRIELSVDATASEAILTVSDSGIGIPHDKLELVFEMFAQINESRDYGHSGLGIGLTLVKQLVEMHGGSVDVQSRGRNLGTTFYVRLPVLPETGRAEEQPFRDQMSTPVPGKRRVLVVDDNVAALESLSRLVQLMGNEVRRAHDGLEAIEIASSFLPDVVLMDLGMPNLNGYDAARRMRMEPWGRELALIATTGWGQAEDRRRTAEAGFDCHLVKPIEANSLREVLSSVAVSRR